jgi:hypothetical protein
METYHNLWMMLTIMRGEVAAAHTYPSKDAALASAKAFFEENSDLSWAAVSEAIERGDCVTTNNLDRETVTVFQVPNNHSQVLDYNV